jgi:hypothetical protein
MGQVDVGRSVAIRSDLQTFMSVLASTLLSFGFSKPNEVLPSKDRVNISASKTSLGNHYQIGGSSELLEISSTWYFIAKVQNNEDGLILFEIEVTALHTSTRIEDGYTQPLDDERVMELAMELNILKMIVTRVSNSSS